MRKEVDIAIAADGRDKGKIFHITEMPALKAEKWGIRAMLALQAAGVILPDYAVSAGMAGVAAHGMAALNRLEFSSVEPLLDEMMECVQIKPSPQITRKCIESDIEEIATILQLRHEVFFLHTGFSVADLLSKSRATSA